MKMWKRGQSPFPHFVNFAIKLRLILKKAVFLLRDNVNPNGKETDSERCDEDA